MGYPRVPAAQGDEAAASRGSDSGLNRFGRWMVVAVAVAWAASVPLGFIFGVAVLNAIGFLAAVVGLRRPSIGLLGVGLLCVLDPPSRTLLLTGGLLRYNSLNYWLFFVALLTMNRLVRLRGAPTALLAVFSLLLALELVISSELELGIQHLVNMMSVFGLLIYFSAGGSRREVWSWLGLICGVAGAGGGLVYYSQMLHLPYMNPNSWAHMPLASILAICLAFPASVSGRRQTALGLLAGVNAVWVLLSGSRGTMLIALVALAFLVALVPGVRRRTQVLAVAAAAIIAVAAQFGALEVVALGRVDRLVDSRYSASSRTSGRFDLMMGGWYIFREHPLGVGTGGFAGAWAELGRREGLSGFKEGQEFAAHAGWIKVLAENGVPGVVLLGAFVASFWWSARRRRNRSIRLIGFLTATSLTAAWVSTEFQAKSLWFLAAGAATMLRWEEPGDFRRRSTQLITSRPKLGASRIQVKS